LRSIASKIEGHLNNVYNSELPDLLFTLFPQKNNAPFTKENHLEKMQSLVADTTIDADQFYTSLNNLLANLNNQLQDNISQCTTIKNFINPYLQASLEIISEESKAILAIIYKDKTVITNLKEFSKSLSRLQRTMNLYHQILKSSSPSDIEILEIQNGSIDLIVNLDVDITLNLVELFKIGFKCFLAYLSYKGMIRPIVETYCGNKKLEAGEAEREKALLENIREAIKKRIKEQHKEALKLDADIDKNIDKKVEQVSSLITSHIVNGNDIKLLALPENEKNDTEENTQEDTVAEFQNLTTNVHTELKHLPEQELVKLIEYYGKNDTEEDVKQ
jgi:hypothetical protein